MSEQVQYIARLTCACGATAEMPASIYTGGCNAGYGRGCSPELEHDNPDGWLGGFDDKHPLECPACVEKRYG